MDVDEFDYRSGIIVIFLHAFTIVGRRASLAGFCIALPVISTDYVTSQ